MNSRSKRNGLFFRVAAVVAAMMPLLAFEIGLRVFGTADDQARLSQGLPPSIPLFTQDKATGRYQTSLPYQQFFAEVSFWPK